MNTIVGNDIWDLSGVKETSEPDGYIDINPNNEPPEDDFLDNFPDSEPPYENNEEDKNPNDWLVVNPKDKTDNNDIRIISPDYITYEGKDVVIIDDLSLPLKNPEKYADKIVFDTHLRMRFGENIFIDPNNPKERAEDRDNDLLKDELEGELANGFKPYFRFDSSEKFRQPFEPITLFQVRPYGYTGLEYNGIYEILIRWTFLIKEDGGYGPN